jgi:tetratricopeptide (TPR) repeat protein
MDKQIKKAEKLFSRAKIDKSFSLYERIIHKRFKLYPKELVEYTWNPYKVPKSPKSSKSPKPPQKVDNQENINGVLNINTHPGLDETNPDIEVFKQNDVSFTKPLINIVEIEDLKLLEMVVIEFNKVGMQYLSQGKIEEARLLLKKLVKLTKSYAKQDLKLIWLTFNNVSCIHKKLGEFKTAHKLLRKALSHAEAGYAQEYLALTYINLSAIYSELKR